MAGFIDSFRDSLQTLTGLPLRSSDLSRPLGLKESSQTSMPDLNDPSRATVYKIDPKQIRLLEAIQPHEKLLETRTFSTAEIPTVFAVDPAQLGEVMATTAVTPSVQGEVLPAGTPVPAAPKQKAPFIRFIDKIGKIGGFLVHEAPEIAKVAQEAEPFLALTPFGAEYKLVVDTIVGAQRTASVTAQVGAQLTGDQKMALVISAITPALTKILESKGVTTGVPEAVAQFAQSVYGLQAGPIALITAGVEAAEAAKPTA